MDSLNCDKKSIKESKEIPAPICFNQGSQTDLKLEDFGPVLTIFESYEGMDSYGNKSESWTQATSPASKKDASTATV